jgi:hypothetical protein
LEELSMANESSVFLNSSAKTAWIKLVSGIYDYNSDIGVYRSQIQYNGVVEVRILR